MPTKAERAAILKEWAEKTPASKEAPPPEPTEAAAPTRAKAKPKRKAPISPPKPDIRRADRLDGSAGPTGLEAMAIHGWLSNH